MLSPSLAQGISGYFFPDPVGLVAAFFASAMHPLQVSGLCLEILGFGEIEGREERQTFILLLAHYRRLGFFCSGEFCAGLLL